MTKCGRVHTWMPDGSCKKCEKKRCSQMRFETDKNPGQCNNHANNSDTGLCSYHRLLIKRNRTAWQYR